QLQWFSDADMMAWVDASRLNVLHHVSAAVSDRAREKIISVLTSQLPTINDKLESLLAQA
ncbi:MAG TPA: NAD(P)/FAD-dependent oxidoreductase, partial [Mycobacterium sp.]